MRIGIAHHFGWAVVVVASGTHDVIDRRRIELVGAGFPSAPIHHEGGAHALHRSRDDLLDDDALAALVDEVRASVAVTSAESLDRVASAVGDQSVDPIVSMSLRSWPEDFPEEISVLRRAPYESRSDSVMYLRVLAELAAQRGWRIHRFDAKRVEAEAVAILGDRAGDVLHGPRARLGPPWTRDHRIALAATVVAASLDP